MRNLAYRQLLLLEHTSPDKGLQYFCIVVIFYGQNIKSDKKEEIDLLAISKLNKSM